MEAVRVGRFLRPANLPRDLEIGRDLLPPIAVEMAWAYYRRLFAAHPERVEGTWNAFAETFAVLAGRVEAVALVEARIPVSSPSRSRDALVRDPHARGELFEVLLAGRPPGLVGTVPGEQRLVAADGIPHPARNAAGPGVDGGVAVHGFGKPGVDARLFRVGDALARTVLGSLRC